MSRQLFMIEIMIDKIGIFIGQGTLEKEVGLIYKMRFGPKEEFIVKEDQLADVEHETTVKEIKDTVFNKKWVRLIRIGRSLLFMSYTDQIATALSQFPLEIEIWSDDKREMIEQIGSGCLRWETAFYNNLKEVSNPDVLHEPFAYKQSVVLLSECCCCRLGELDIIMRLTALGDSVITEFQEIVEDNSFCFRTNKAPNMYKCKRREGDDINFCMIGTLYETTSLEDPTVIENMGAKLEVCTEVSNCNKDEDSKPKRIPGVVPLQKIKMGDIAGPCGNTNCPLAHKVKTYLRGLNIYKEQTKDKKISDKNLEGKKPCGSCDCKEGRWHREKCPQNIDDTNAAPVCSGCGGVAKSGETCKDRIDKKLKNPQVNYVTTIVRGPELVKPFFGEHLIKNSSKNPQLMKSLFGQDFIFDPMDTVTNKDPKFTRPLFKQEFVVNPCEINFPTPNVPLQKCCTCGKNAHSMGNLDAFVYNADTKTEGGKKVTSTFCTDIPDEKDKECKCNPPVPTPPCKTFDCECLLQAKEKETRKVHKSWCPAYKHRATCPVTMAMNEEEVEVDEDDVEPFPYGLPPVQMAPCPVVGRPCSVPDGYARMYKVGATPALPPSYSDAGKVCCSKEFERIKKAIGEYMKAHEKTDDYRCLNKFNVDTDRRCCDKEQRLRTLTEKSCCKSCSMTDNDKDKK